MPNKNLHVISHTHWDREWYLTFQRFRMKLVDLIDKLLDLLEKDPDFKYFNFDAQTIVLQDYLEIRPQKKEILKKLISEGRILVGPWYQLNDENLVSGESTIRSLLIGHEISKEFGITMKVGYLPDQFGHISQMPQILNGFDIDNAIFGRGYEIKNDRKLEFYWKSPDGSKVLSSFMAFWYNNAQRFPSDTDESVNYTQRLVEMMSPLSLTNELLLMNGVDHLEAQYDLSDIIKRTNKKLKGSKLIHSSLPNYIDAIRKKVKESNIKLDTAIGELREDNHANILAGTLSSRIYLKQTNEKCQTILEKYAEPFAMFADTLGDSYDLDYFNYIWKLLMQNHPHDSICGCSIDQVHKEMMPRFDQVEQVGKDLTERALKTICDNIKTDSDSLVVFNPLNWQRTDRIHTFIDFPLCDPVRLNPVEDPARDVAAIKILDTDGNEVPYYQIKRSKLIKQHLRPDELPFVYIARRFEIEFVAEDIPSCGYKTYKIEKVPMKPNYDEYSLVTESYGSNAIGNDNLSIELNLNGITIQKFSENEDEVDYFAFNINSFEDMGDFGDEYRHMTPDNNSTIINRVSPDNVTIIDRSPISATMKIDTVLRVPEKADEVELKRSDNLVDCPITTYLTITKGVDRVDIKTIINNNAKDHRIRVLFPTGIKCNSSFAESQFDVIERPICTPKEWINAAQTYPQQRWVDICDEMKGLCVINKGLPEYELLPDSDRTLALTLLRCVGMISGGIAGGADIPGADLTPEAQCIGEHTFEYSLYPHNGDWKKAAVWQNAHQHNIPLLVMQTTEHDGCLPLEQSFVTISHKEIIVSAIKKSQDNSMAVLRVFNITDDNQKDVKIYFKSAKKAFLLNLNEEKQKDIKCKDETIKIDIPAKKIMTFGFEI
ncbi:MAG: glycoside hydrolase family 38 C-terminal domain-containing protein [Armatimonadota bacterium]